MSAFWDGLGSISVGVFVGSVLFFLFGFFFRAVLEATLRKFTKEHAEIQLLTEDIDRELGELGEGWKKLGEVVSEEERNMHSLVDRVRVMEHEIDERDPVPADRERLAALKQELAQRRAAQVELDASVKKLDARREELLRRSASVKAGIHRLRVLALRSQKFYRFLQIWGGGRMPWRGERR
jgi:hypothetical protein